MPAATLTNSHWRMPTALARRARAFCKRLSGKRPRAICSASRQFFAADDLAKIHFFGGLLDVRVLNAFGAQADVAADRAGEEKRILQHDTEKFAPSIDESPRVDVRLP